MSDVDIAVATISFHQKTQEKIQHTRSIITNPSLLPCFFHIKKNWNNLSWNNYRPLLFTMSFFIYPIQNSPPQKKKTNTSQLISRQVTVSTEIRSAPIPANSRPGHPSFRSPWANRPSRATSSRIDPGSLFKATATRGKKRPHFLGWSWLLRFWCITSAFLEFCCGFFFFGGISGDVRITSKKF